METRRDFLTGAAFAGLMVAAAGCSSARNNFGFGAGGAMQGHVAPKLKRIRVGVVGLGARGTWAAQRLNGVPGVDVVAVCEIVQEKIDKYVAWCKEQKRPEPKWRYFGENAWRDLCQNREIDAVYNVTPWALHAPIAKYAMECGKHAFVEVPGCLTVDEAWDLVETSERTKFNCMMLENCCYGEAELLALSLCRQGLLGDLVHGEGAYIHDLRGLYASKPGSIERWRKLENDFHKGNRYPTHGLGPVCQYLGINRGDRFDYLTSLESNAASSIAYAKAVSGKDENPAMGDMNVTMIKTALGRSIMVQHDVASPRSYSRINRITGTKGCFEGIQFPDPEGKDPYADPVRSGCYCRFGWESKPGEGVHAYFDAKTVEEMRAKYMHPLFRTAGEIAKKVGGHGGMDYLMDLRWAYCLQNGEPLDQNVYDLAAWSSLCELTETSVRAGSKPVKAPDFTRGAWKTTPALGLVDMDMSKLEFDTSAAEKGTGMTI
ncbi:MAG: Gfo/Idh/MocA family oxidoreductase [Kiritimatiellae bacterium]|nr:Gfo/Idh/MocA family oxidoreductase [Kiritimatiellia bacterium]